MDRREVAAAGNVVLGRLQRARPEILEVLGAVIAVRFGVVQLHRRQMTGVAARMRSQRFVVGSLICQLTNSKSQLHELLTVGV